MTERVTRLPRYAERWSRAIPVALLMLVGGSAVATAAPAPRTPNPAFAAGKEGGPITAHGPRSRPGAKPARARAAAGCAPARSVAAIVDDSGSMSGNDPAGIRRRALELLITKPSGQARTLSAVEFGSSALPLFEPSFVGSGRAGMLAALSEIDDDFGDTDYNEAFTTSRDLHPNADARIFLTDGEHNDGPYLGQHRGGPRTYVIGLNIGPAGKGNRDADRLQQIARETGGRYFPLKLRSREGTATQLSRLQPTMNQIDALLACQASPKRARRFFVRRGQTGRPFRGSFGGFPAMEVVFSWGTPGMDCILVRAEVRDRRGRVIGDLKGKRRIGRSRKRRQRLVLQVIDGVTFNTITIKRPVGGRTLTVWIKAKRLTRPAPVTIQLRPIALPPQVTPVPPGFRPPVTKPPTIGKPPTPTAPTRRVIAVDNRVTNGLGMREDPIPVRLTTKPWKFCGSRGCNINGTERVSGQTYDAAGCQTQGERTTNGHDTDPRDDANPLRFESTRYYGVRLPDGTFGYVSEVWIRAADRGGLGLQSC